MSSRTIPATIALVVLTWSAASAEPCTPPGGVRDELATYREFLELERTGHTIAHVSQCAYHYEDLGKLYRSIESLNAAHKEKPVPNYAQTVARLKRENKETRDIYRHCFAQQLTTTFRATSETYGLRDYVAFRARYRELKKKLQGIDVAGRVAEIEATLERESRSAAHVALLKSVVGQVQLRRDGRWCDAAQGIGVSLPDEIRTGARGRARIEFLDRDDKENAGPTIVNVGPDTQIRIVQFFVSFNDPPRREGLIDLLKGTIRAFTKNWGARSAFSVRTGASLCGIRGTDIAIQHEPSADRVSYFLDHGRVDISTPSGGISLSDGQKLTVSQGRPGPVEAMRPGEWPALAAATAPDSGRQPARRRAPRVDQPAPPAGVSDEQEAHAAAGRFLDAFSRLDAAYLLDHATAFMADAWDSFADPDELRLFLESKAEYPVQWRLGDVRCQRSVNICYRGFSAEKHCFDGVDVCAVDVGVVEKKSPDHWVGWTFHLLKQAGRWKTADSLPMSEQALDAFERKYGGL